MKVKDSCLYINIVTVLIIIIIVIISFNVHKEISNYKKEIVEEILETSIVNELSDEKIHTLESEAIIVQLCKDIELLESLLGKDSHIDTIIYSDLDSLHTNTGFSNFSLTGELEPNFNIILE